MRAGQNTRGVGAALDDDGERDERDDRRIDAVHPRERHDEDEHAGDCGDAGLDEHRDRDERAHRSRPRAGAATTRAAGVHTPPGTYFASIETISARNAAG